MFVYFFYFENYSTQVVFNGKWSLGWIMYFEDCNYNIYDVSLRKVYYSFLCIPWYISKVVYSPVQPYKVVLQFFMEYP